MSRFFHYLNEREAANNEHEDPHLVLLLLGDDAQDTVDNLQLADNQRVRKIEPYHPTNRQNRYFQGSNPLQRVNEELRELGGQEISWWE